MCCSSDVPQNGFTFQSGLPVSKFPGETLWRKSEHKKMQKALEDPEKLPIEYTFDRSAAWNAARDRIDLTNRPLCVIMDLGCTRSMGSLNAIKKLERYGRRVGITRKWKPCNTLMTFANGDCTRLTQCVEVTFPTSPPITTTIDCHEKGDIPILFSINRCAH